MRKKSKEQTVKDLEAAFSVTEYFLNNLFDQYARAYMNLRTANSGLLFDHGDLLQKNLEEKKQLLFNVLKKAGTNIV